MSSSRLPVTACRAPKLLSSLIGSYDWRTTVLIGLLLFASATQWMVLGVLNSTAGSDRDIAITIATGAVWSVLLVYACGRRRIGVTEGGLILAVTIVLILVLGFSEDSEALRSMTTAAMPTVPVAAVMYFRRRGVLLFTAAAMAADSLIVLNISAPLALRVLTAAATVSMVALPIVVVLALLKQVEGARDLAKRLASTDQLTGLLNRRGMRDGFGGAVAAVEGGAQVLTVMVADIDHFKSVNDTYGHDAGDQVLVAVARALEANAREGDLLVRLGGEEIAWVGAFPTPLDADGAAERARAAVQAVSLAGLPGVTISIGVATAAIGEGDVDAVLSAVLTRADRALYAAKAAGRNRVVRSEEEPAEGRLPPRVPVPSGPAPTLPA